MRARIPLRLTAELATERRFDFGVAPRWHPNADSTSAWRRARNGTQISFWCGAELASGCGFHFGVAQSWNLGEDFFQRGAELEFGRGFHFAVALSWNPSSD